MTWVMSSPVWRLSKKRNGSPVAPVVRPPASPSEAVSDAVSVVISTPTVATDTCTSCSLLDRSIPDTPGKRWRKVAITTRPDRS